MKCCAVKAPGFGDRRKAMLEDIAVLTGAQVVSEELGPQARDMSRSPSLASAKRVVIDKDNTTIIGGSGDREQIDGRIAQIRREIEKTTSDYDREKLQERLAKLSGGVAVIRVGAPSRSRDESEKGKRSTMRSTRRRRPSPEGHRSRRRARAVALYRGHPAGEAKICEGDEKTGVQILKRAARGADAADRRKFRRSTAASSSPVCWAARATRASTRHERNMSI